MDPLSITAGILAIIGAVNSSISATVKFCEAPQELSLLRDELDHFCAVIQDIESMQIDIKWHKSLFTALQQSKTVITSLDKQLRQRILAHEGKMAIRFAWLKHSSRTRELRKQLQLSRSKIVEALGVANLSSTASLSMNQREMRTFTEHMMNQTLSTMRVQSSISSVKAAPEPTHTVSLIQAPRMPMDAGQGSGIITTHERALTSLPSVTMQLPENYSSDVSDNLILLNKSMHFKDRSYPDKFFLTYMDSASAWRKLTISCNFENLLANSMLINVKKLQYQRDKANFLLEILWGSLPSLRLCPTVTNLRLQELDGQLHVHVTEDSNEAIPYPRVSLVRFLDIPWYTMRDVEVIQHLGGFSSRVKIRGQSQDYVLAQVPSPMRVEDFLRELIYLYSLNGNPDIISLYGVVVESESDDRDGRVIARLVTFAARGALVDIVYDARQQDGISWELREKWTCQIVRGLAAFHGKGYVYGDFDMTSIHIDEHDNAQIGTNYTIGLPSVGWESPEICLLQEAGLKIDPFVNQKSDVFQLGMVLWGLAMLEDEPERQDRPLVWPATIEGEIPRYIRTIVQLCLSPDPENRPFVRDLLRFIPNPETDGS